MKIRETKDLLLKMGQFDDWQDMYENLWSHNDSTKYMLWIPTHSEEEAKIRMQKSIEYQRRNPLAYFVYEKTSGKAIGFAGMTKISDNKYEDTGVAIGPSFVRKGYGKQILMELVKEAFNELGADKFVSSCRSKNEASRQLQLSCGFTYAHSENRIDSRTGEAYVLEFYELTKVD